MILRKGDTFTDPKGETWQLIDVRRKKITVAHIYDGKASGITATVSRRSIEGWERA